MPMNNTEKNVYAAGSGRNARETAYRIIRDKIIGCELKPGEAISDKQLAEELQMSRTPVREALIILSTSNMVVLKGEGNHHKSLRPAYGGTSMAVRGESSNLSALCAAAGRKQRKESSPPG